MISYHHEDTKFTKNVIVNHSRILFNLWCGFYVFVVLNSYNHENTKLMKNEIFIFVFVFLFFRAFVVNIYFFIYGLCSSGWRVRIL